MKITNEMRPIDPVTSSDIQENVIKETMPDILDILLVDRTTSDAKTRRNIIWANDNYLGYGIKDYAPTAQIKPDLITGLSDGGADVKIMDRFFRHRKVPLPRKIFKTRISA
ncbi:hypothetical protein ACHWP0_06845 [Weissella cibaria]|uniref:hypothetical protein n=1 Tax=Weissella cibaria TaxID=137591 RepID=UPI00376EE597